MIHSDHTRALETSHEHLARLALSIADVLESLGHTTAADIARLTLLASVPPAVRAPLDRAGLIALLPADFVGRTLHQLSEV